jgi:peptidoglycan/LPS O-acetylase OafA/YrhL
MLALRRPRGGDRGVRARPRGRDLRRAAGAGALFVLTAVVLAVGSTGGNPPVGVLIVSLLMMAVVLAYVRHREATLFGRPGARVLPLRLPVRLRRP